MTLSPIAAKVHASMAIAAIKQNDPADSQHDPQTAPLRCSGQAGILNVTMTKNGGILANAATFPEDLRVETERLLLVPGTLALWEAEREGHKKRLAELLQAQIPDSWPPPPVPDPTEGGWWSWYFLTRETPVAPRSLIGSGGVKGWAALDGNIQLGCSFLPEFQSSGYGTEAIGALTRWAMKQPNTQRVYAEVCLDNKAAVDLLKRVGFVMAGKGSRDPLVRFKYE